MITVDVHGASIQCFVNVFNCLKLSQGNSSWVGEGYFPSFPATCPYVTAVGGTMGINFGEPEVAWQPSVGAEGGGLSEGATGGGFSTYFAQPNWQTKTVEAYFDGLPSSEIPTDGYNSMGRAYPDVSLVSLDYLVVVNNSLLLVSGTSASSPTFAAMISLVNAARLLDGKPTVGYINPTLWAFSVHNSYGVDGSNWYPFNDITSGNNKCPSLDNGTAECCESGFYTAKGWDPVTGLGSIQYPNLTAIFNIGDISIRKL